MSNITPDANPVSPQMPYNNNAYNDGTNNVYVNVYSITNTNSVVYTFQSFSEVDPFVSGSSSLGYNYTIFYYDTTTQVTGTTIGLSPGSHTTTITPSSLIAGGSTNAAIGRKLYILFYSSLLYTTSTGSSLNLPSNYNSGEGSLANPGGLQTGYTLTIQPCSQPYNVVATSYQNSQVPLTWSAPVDDGGSAITSYLIQYSSSTSSGPWSSPFNTGSSSTSYIVPNLTNGTQYYFQVAAVNGYCNTQFIVAVGQGQNKIAYSYNGINWTGLGNIIFDTSGYNVSWNGTMWIAVGRGSNSNTIAYSYDGINNWTGLGNSIFTTACYDVAWNGSMWVAVGQGLNTIAYSYDGINWNAVLNSNSIFNYAGLGVAWGGDKWIAVGSAPSYIAYSTDGINWVGTGVTLINNVNKIAWNGTMWVAVADGPNHTIAYSYNGINNWIGLGNTIFTNTGYDVAWGGGSSGNKWVAVGSGLNTIAYSYNGIDWFPVANSSSFFSSGGVGVAWSGTTWVAVGEVTNTIAYSSDGITWVNVTNSANIFSLGRGVYGTLDYGPDSGLFSDSSNSATPSTIPSQVQNVITSPGPAAGNINVSWAAINYPNDGGAAVTSYTLQYRTSGPPPGSWSTISGIPSTSYIITGLANGTTYDIQVAAVNNSGQGPYSNITIGETFDTPQSPTGLSGQHGNAQVILTWIAPTNTGGTPITGYIVERSTSSSGPWTQLPTGSTTPSYTATGLINGTPYFFRVSAVNIVGTGPPSTTISVTPSTIPGPAIIISSVSCDNQQVLVTWASTSPPVDTGGAPILSYNMQYSTSATGPWLPTTPYSVNAPTTTYTFTGLTNGIPYYFQVQAINMNGPGPYSAQTASSTATPSITPQAPSPITSTATTSSSITLSWTAPTITGGNPVTGYLIYWSQASPSGTIIPPINSYTISGAPPATTYTIPGLTHATLYAFQISSISCSGVGPKSAPAFYVTTSSIPPTAPTNVAISGCNTGYTNSVILTWTAPADDGGSPITNYIVYYRTTSPVGIWYTYNTNSDATTTILPLPSSGTSYDFKVAAQNVAGVSVFSSPIVSSSSYNPPTAPTNLVSTNLISNTSSNGSIVLSWSPSSQEGAQTISYYVIEYKICEFGGWITYPTTIPHPTTSTTLSNIGASSSSNIANNLPYLFRVYAVNSCGARSDSTDISSAVSYNNSEPTRLWPRFNINCAGNITSFDTLTRNMLRKGQVLQYPGVGNLQYSRATLWSMAAKNQLSRKKAWASQSEEYTYPNTTNINNEPGVGLRQTPTSLVCWTPPPTLICNPASSSGVPGNNTTLCFSKNAPFNNFRKPITYASGGTKWPVFFSK